MWFLNCPSLSEAVRLRSDVRSMSGGRDRYLSLILYRGMRRRSACPCLGRSWQRGNRGKGCLWCWGAQRAKWVGVISFPLGQDRAPTPVQPHGKGRTKGCTHTHTGRIIPHIFSRADQPFTIPSPLRKWPSRPRDRQGGKRGTCWNWVGWSELWAICNRNCSQPRLNAFAVIQGGFCDHQPAGWSNNEKYNTPCPNPLNMVSVHSYPLAVLQ